MFGRRRRTVRHLVMLLGAVGGSLVTAGVVTPASAAGDEVINEPLASTSGTEYQVAHRPDVSADGRYVVYEVETNGAVYGSSAHWLDRTSGDRLLVTGTDQTVDGDGSSAGVSVSDDGRLIAYGRYDRAQDDPTGPGRSHVYLRDRTVSDSTVRLDIPHAGGVDGEAHSPVVSGNGEYVVFNSTAQLVSADTNFGYDAYRYTVATGAIELVSRGAETDTISAYPDVSADGTKVVFTTADPLLPQDTNGPDATGSGFDVYVRDVSTGALGLVTTNQDGDSGYMNGDLRISADGSTVVFTTSSTQLVGGDTNGSAADLIATNLSTGSTQRVSVWGNGLQSFDFSTGPSISGNGRFVGFLSRGDASWPTGPSFERAFVRDLATGTTTLESLDAADQPVNAWGGRPTAMSATSGLLLYTAQDGNLHAHQLAVAPPAARVLTGSIAVNTAPPSPGEQPGVLACPVGTSGATCPGGKLVLADEVTGAFSLTLDDGVDYSILAFAYGGGATSAPIVWNAGSPNPSPVLLQINFATVYGVVTAVSGVVGNLGVGACPVPQVYPATCPSLKFDMAEGPGSYTLRLPAGTYNLSGFAQAPDGSVVKGMRQQLTFANNAMYHVDFVVDPSNARALTGRVTANGGPLPAFSGAAVAACPLVNGQLANCSMPMLAQVDAAGYFNLPLPSGTDVGIAAVMQGGSIRTAPIVWLAADPDPSPAFFNLEYGTLQGSLGAAPGVTGNTGVGACLDPATWPCSPVWAVYSSSGSYALKLPPGTYNTSGFAQQGDGSVVQGARLKVTIGVGQTITQNYYVDPSASAAVESQVGGDGDLNDDGVADSDQLNVAAVPAAVDGEFIAVASAPGDTVTEVSVVPASEAPVPLPSNAAFDDNVLSFKIPVEVGGTRTVSVFYSAPIAPGSAYVKLIDGAWQSYGTIDYAANRVTLTLTDGGVGDTDGVANGVIVDPGVLARPSASGLFAPIDMGITNVARAGSAVPVKWRLTVGSVGVNAVSTFQGISSSGAVCGAGASDVVESTSTGDGLQYLGDGVWQFDWKTQKAWAGHCRTLTLEVGGHEFTASFRFTK